MQKGSIRISGKWWYFKVRENVIENGQSVRKPMYHKLAPVAQYRPSSNGEPPPAVRAMADEKLAPINAGKREGLSADSFKSFLESYLQAGVGGDGRPVRKVTLKAYRRDYKMIAELIPDIQLRNVRTPDINRLFKALIAKDGDDIRATSSYRNVRNFLSGAFRAAVGDGLADFNPVRDAMTITGNDADTHAYTLPEVKQLMKVIKLEDEKSEDDWQHTMRAAFMVVLFTGLRLEEIKGLKWEDYNRQQQSDSGAYENKRERCSCSGREDGGEGTGSAFETKFRRRIYLPQGGPSSTDHLRTHCAHQSASGVPGGWHQVPRVPCLASWFEYRDEGPRYRPQPSRRHHAPPTEERHRQALWSRLGQPDACGVGEDRSGVLEGQVITPSPSPSAPWFGGDAENASDAEYSVSNPTPEAARKSNSFRGF
jgi:hypothetical protein